MLCSAYSLEDILRTDDNYEYCTVFKSCHGHSKSALCIAEVQSISQVRYCLAAVAAMALQRFRSIQSSTLISAPVQRFALS